MRDVTAARIHLAKQPGAAVLTSWCGVSERRARKQDGVTIYCADENPIVRSGEWTCGACAFRMRAESSRILALLGARSAEVEALRDAAMATSCGNHGCICAPVRGVGTNGACHCPEDPRHVRSAMTAWRRYAMALEGQPTTAASSDAALTEDAMRSVLASELWPRTLEMMRHALGLDNSTGAKRAYRNYYSVVTDVAPERASVVLSQWRALVHAGLAVCTGVTTDDRRSAPMQSFQLTQKGICLVMDYSERERETGA